MRLSGTETFAIECMDLLSAKSDDTILLYSPIREEIALIDKTMLELISPYLIKGEVPNDEDLKDLYETFHQPQIAEIPIRDVSKSDRMSLIPNLTCNFSCTYCYSAKGRSGAVLNWEKAKAGLDYFIDSQRIENKYISLFISGGGEPLATWPLTGRIIEYARQRSESQGLNLQISIITNGSLVTEEIAEALAQNKCVVGVSFEVIEDLQNMQRKMWHKVRDNIYLLHKHGVTVKMNSTITPASVDRMAEMVETVIRDYPFLAEYTMEPVTSVELFSNADELGLFYDRFFESYITCSEIAESSKTNLRFTFDDAMRGITVRHCPGKFCLTPTGKISVCHLVSSPKEERFKNCIYGEITDGGEVVLDKPRFDELYSINVGHYERCRDCFAKWDCGGECMTRNAIYPASYMEKVCEFNRRFVKHVLLKKVEATIREEYGISLTEYLSNNQ